MTIPQYIDALTEAIENLSFVEITFFKVEGSESDIPIMFPVLNSCIDDERFNSLSFFENYYGLGDIISNRKGLRIDVGRYKSLKIKAYDIILVLQSGIRGYRTYDWRNKQSLNAGQVEGKTILESLIRDRSRSGSVFYPLEYTPDSLQNLNLGKYDWEIAFSWVKHDELQLVRLAFRYFSNLKKDIIINFLQEVVNFYKSPSSPHHYFHFLSPLSMLDSSIELENEFVVPSNDIPLIAEREWKYHTLLIFKMYEKLFESAKLKDIWDIVTSFCKEDSMTNKDFPFCIKSKYKKDELFKLHKFLINNHLIDEDTQKYDFLYYFGGGGVDYFPSGKIRWKSNDKAAFYAFADLIHTPKYHRWENLKKIISTEGTNFNICSEGHSSVKRNMDNGGDTPFMMWVKNYLETMGRDKKRWRDLISN